MKDEKDGPAIGSGVGKECHYDVVVNTIEEAQGVVPLLRKITGWNVEEPTLTYLPFTTKDGKKGAYWAKPGLLAGHTIVFYEVQSVEEFLLDNNLTVPVSHKGTDHPRNGKPWAVILGLGTEFLGIHEV